MPCATATAHGWRQLLAAEFTLNGAAGELDREAFLEATSGPYEIDDWAYEEIDPEVYGDTAVVVSRYRQTARLAGRDLSHRMHVTDIWVRRRRALADRAPPRHDRGLASAAGGRLQVSRPGRPSIERAFRSRT